jgi:hypothetical protein
MGNVLDASVIDEVTDALQIETPNGKTVSRLTLNDLPVLSADAAVFAGGSAMVAVDLCGRPRDAQPWQARPRHEPRHAGPQHTGAGDAWQCAAL